MTSISKTTTGLEEATRVLALVREMKIRSSQGLLSAKEIGYDATGDNRTLTLVEKYGYRGLQALQLGVELEIARRCVTGAAQTLHLQRRIQSVEVASWLAVAKHCRIGACAELATVTWLNLDEAWFIQSGPDLSPKDAGYEQAKQNWHCFVVTGVKPGQLKVGQKLGTLFALKNLIIIDPFFNFACRGPDLFKVGTELMDWWKGYHHQLIVGLKRHTNLQAKTFQDAELVFKTSKSHAAAVFSKPDVIQLCGQVEKAVTDLIKPRCDQALAVITPGAKWDFRPTKKPTNYELVAKSLGVAERIELIQYDIAFYVSEEGEVILHHFDPDLLAAKALSVDNICSWTGLQSPQVRLILRLMAPS
jgi:hypothetical protein